jgi:ACR3 family arsenite efflux pump ArsB
VTTRRRGLKMNDTFILIEAVIFNLLLALGSLAFLGFVIVTMVKELRELKRGSGAGRASIPRLLLRVFLFVILPVIVFAGSAVGLAICHRVWVG